MLIYIMFLCALAVIMFLTQFTSYSYSIQKVLSSNNSLTEQCATTLQTEVAESINGFDKHTV
jgi:hypothetical protein